MKKHLFLLLLTVYCSSATTTKNAECFRSGRDGISTFCCNNHEWKNGRCVECTAGYMSTGHGKPCEPCRSNRYGPKCSYGCNCSPSQRCDPVVGCVIDEEIELDIFVELEDESSDDTINQNRTEKNISTEDKLPGILTSDPVQYNRENHTLSIEYINSTGDINTASAQPVTTSVEQIYVLSNMSKEKDHSELSIKYILAYTSAAVGCFVLVIVLAYYKWRKVSGNHQKSRTYRIVNIDPPDVHIRGEALYETIDVNKMNQNNNLVIDPKTSTKDVTSETHEDKISLGNAECLNSYLEFVSELNETNVSHR
ncbi:uncharacterized protein LOC127704481 [Mytilus californianus]|uniref:uncharacterized protein LOC127704481 n=1 Tax=Mytilus californianus TaxID=6549 RepID=UPI0022460DE3|nr:uncharacterized protein LOC127704481 [Mytilus californianus]